jgi:predicted lipoprotein with Yx(FWY)xxD motif
MKVAENQRVYLRRNESGWECAAFFKWYVIEKNNMGTSRLHAESTLVAHLFAAHSHLGDMMKKAMLTSLALAFTLLTGCASMSGSAPAAMKDGMMVNAKGMTLYTFDKDAAGSGKSVCNDKCAVAWPPMLATANDKPTGDWVVITRDNGQKQWAYKGKPLYTWPEDQEPGDKFGDNYLKVWHIVK